MTTMVHGKCRPSTGERVFAFLVMAVLLGVFSFILVSDDVEITTDELPIAIILLAILGFAFGSLVPALLNISFQKHGLKVKAAGGAAMFFLILYFGFQAIGVPVAAGSADGQSMAGQTENRYPDVYAELLGMVYGQAWTQQTTTTAYSACYADYGFGAQMVQSFWGSGSSLGQAQLNANYACTSVCSGLGGTCAPMN